MPTFTTPITWTPDLLVGPDEMNQQVRDNIAYLKAQADAVSVMATATALAGTQNNFSVPAGRHVTVPCNNAALLTITGFVVVGTPVNGDVIEVLSKNAQVDFAHQNSGTTVATNRLFNIVTSCNTSIVKGSAVFVYDGTAWRMSAHEQGGWIDSSTRTTATAAGGGSVSVAISSAKYKIAGRTCTWNLYVQFTPSGTVTYADLINPAAGMTHGSALHCVGVCAVLSGAANVLGGYAQSPSIGSLSTRFYQHDATSALNYAVGANQFLGSLTFEIQ